MASEKKDVIEPAEGQPGSKGGEKNEASHQQYYAADGTDKVINNAKAATDKERSMSLLQGIKTYPKAVGWSILISTCIVMEGYDVSLISNFYAFDPFNRKYGVQGDDGTYEVPAPVSRSSPVLPGVQV